MKALMSRPNVLNNDYGLREGKDLIYKVHISLNRQHN